MANLQPLADLLSGAGGHPVDRQGLNAFVANSQANNNLRSAQTEEALNHAQQQQDEMKASGDLEGALGNIMGDNAKAHAAATIMKAHFGDAKSAFQALLDNQQLQNRTTLSDPTQLNSPTQTAAQQGLSGKVATPEAVPHEFATLPGMAAPNVEETPQGQAAVNSVDATANLHNAQAKAGGFNPHTGGGSTRTGDPQADAALDKAIAEGRLDPSRVNSRTAAIFAGIEQRNPGTINFNRLTADAALQRNATFQQKAMTMETLPTIMSHMTALGKKIGYSDNRTAGKVQQFMNGEFNDPDYAEYTSVRNDALMNIANVMRGVGMSDQAHRAEMEAAAPTMSPLALDGWLKGQMSSIQPRLDQQRRVTHLGDKPATTPAGGADQSDPLGLRSK